MKERFARGIAALGFITAVFMAGTSSAWATTHYTVGPAGYDTEGNSQLIIAGSQTPTIGDGDHVVICHALGENNKDTYIQIAPSTGDVFGHAGNSHQLGQDIIPPFKYVSNSGNKEDDSLQNGQNWTTANIAIYNNGCQSLTPPTEEKGSITVVKHLVPTNDSGLFNLKVGSTVVAANVGNNGTGTANDLSAGYYTVSETAGTNTSMSDYASTVSCTDNSTGTTSTTVNLSAGEDVTCTFTNTHGGHGGGEMDCDGDFDNSPASECETTPPTTPPTGGQGGGAITEVTTPTTTTTTTTTGGQGAGEVTTVPSGAVSAGEGGGSAALNLSSLIGLVGSLGIGGLALRRSNNES